MKSVNMHEAKTHLSRLVEEAVNGKPFIIAKNGHAMVKVVAVTEPVATKPMRLGFMEGEFNVPDNFDHMFEDDIAALFDGES